MRNPAQKYSQYDGVCPEYCVNGNCRVKITFKIVFTNERLIPPSGLGIVGGMLGESDFVKQCDRIPVDKKRSEPQIKNSDILLSYIGILCQGKKEYDAVNEMKDDPDYYMSARGIARAIPSPETLRQRMDDIGASLRPKFWRPTRRCSTPTG